MPQPEYLNFVGKLSELRMGGEPVHQSHPEQDDEELKDHHGQDVLALDRQGEGVREKGREPNAKYATTLRLHRSANGPLRSTPSTSAIRLRNMIVAVVTKGKPAKWPSSWVISSQEGA